MTATAGVCSRKIISAARKLVTLFANLVLAAFDTHRFPVHFVDCPPIWFSNVVSFLCPAAGRKQSLESWATNMPCVWQYFSRWV